MSTLPQVGVVDTSATCLYLTIKNASVSIQYAEGEHIVVRANHPTHWELKDGRAVSQIDSQEPLGRGSLTIAKGVVGPSALSTSGCNVVISGGEVWKNQLKVTSDFEEPANQGVSNSWPDELVVLVPPDFQGGLWIASEGGSRFTLPSWVGKSVMIYDSSDGHFELGCLELESGFFLNTTRHATIEVESVKAGDFTLEYSGSGTVNIRALTAENVTLTHRGVGNVTIGAVPVG